MKPESPGMILGDLIDNVNAWSVVIGGSVVTGVGGSIIALYFLFRKKRTEAKREDIGVDREQAEADLAMRGKEDAADHANETYAVQVMRGLYDDLQAEFRQAKKDHVALEKSVVKIQLEAFTTLGKCLQEHAITTERLRVSEATAVAAKAEAEELKAEVRALETRLEAVERRT